MSLLAGRQQRDLSYSDFFGSEQGGVQWVGDGHEEALRIAPVFSAVGLIADSFAQLPWTMHRGVFGASKPVPLPEWLSKPSVSLSIVDWRFQLAASLKLRGNAYGYVTGEYPTARPTGIVWLHPDTVSVTDVDAHTVPEYNIGTHAAQRLYQHGGRIIHVREFLMPGKHKGLSPIGLFKKQLETAEWAAQYGHEFFRNATRPSGILRYKKGGLKVGGASEAKKMFKESTANGDIATLDGDWEWQSLTITPEEAQFLRTIKANANIVASIFRVPPEDIGGESGSSMRYSNRESDQAVLNTRTLAPLTSRAVAAFQPMLDDGAFLDIPLDRLSQPTELERARTDTERLRNGTRFLAEIRQRDNLAAYTAQQIAEWQQWYATTKSESESVAESIATSITKEQA